MKGVKGHNPEKIIVLKNIDTLEDLPEIEGKVAFISQSTQSMERFDKAAELVQQKYTEVRIKNTICDATRQRQTSILDLAPRMDLMIVVGSQTSANSQRLAQISQKSGTPAYLIDNAAEIKAGWLDRCRGIWGSPPAPRLPIGLSWMWSTQSKKLADEAGMRYCQRRRREI